jgi:hypothetical protein
MKESTKVKPCAAGYTKQAAKQQMSTSGIDKHMKRLLAEELQKVVFITKGGETKSVTKAAVIAAQLVNRAMAGDRAQLQWLLEIAMHLPPPLLGVVEFRDRSESVFRITPEQQELLDELKKLGPDDEPDNIMPEPWPWGKA